MYPTPRDVEKSVLEILNVITNTFQVSVLYFVSSFSVCSSVSWTSIIICITDSQKVQTVQSWLGHASPSFVNAKVTGDYFLWAQSTVKSAVLKNMEGPGKHFQSYGTKILSFLN